MSKAEEYHKPKEWTPTMVGGSKELTDEVYVSKHGLRIRRSADIGNTHWEIIKSMADKDPDLISNMHAGRYMPRCNGNRIHYRGKDAGLGMKVAFWNFILDPLILGMIVLLIIALIAM